MAADGPADSAKDAMCTLCMEPLGDPILNQTLDCGHTFRSTCVQSLRDGAVDNVCAACSPATGAELQFERCARMFHLYCCRAGFQSCNEPIRITDMQPKGQSHQRRTYYLARARPPPGTAHRTSIALHPTSAAHYTTTTPPHHARFFPWRRLVLLPPSPRPLAHHTRTTLPADQGQFSKVLDTMGEVRAWVKVDGNWEGERDDGPSTPGPPNPRPLLPILAFA